MSDHIQILKSKLSQLDETDLKLCSWSLGLDFEAERDELIY